MPVQVPTVEIYAGDTGHWPVYTVQDPEGNPRELISEGWTDWKAQWRADPTATEVVELIVDASRADEGMLIIRATPDQTAAMASAGVWDLQATNGDEVKTWFRGKTKYIQDVTRG